MCDCLWKLSTMANEIDVASEHAISSSIFSSSHSSSVYIQRSIEGSNFRGGGQFLQLVDLFISQHVKETNRFGAFLSTSRIVDKLSKSAQIVWIPNIYFDGYFPQQIENAHKICTETDPQGRFPHGDRFVDEIMENSEMNPDVEKILDKISDPNFIAPSEIQRCIDESLSELYRREEICDVKIASYIEDNYREKQIFYSQNHPVPTVMLEIAKRILRCIGIRSENFSAISEMIDENNLSICLVGKDISVYPAVHRFFNFEEFPKQYWANRYIWDFRANFRDFQREYIKQCWVERFSR